MSSFVAAAWQRLTGRSEVVGAALDARPHFGLGDESGVLYGTPTLDDFIFRTGKISRAEALRVPAVKRARDLICGAIGQFPLRFYDASGKPAQNFTPNLFQQPEDGIAPSVTWTRVVEDMLLDERAWLRTKAVGFHGRPVTVHRLDADTVNVHPEYVYYPEGSATVWPERPGLIRIDSPNPGLLANSPAVRACIALQRATLRHLDGTPPLDYFTIKDGEPDPTPTEVVKVLDAWHDGRRDGYTGFVPSWLDYNVAGWDPQKLQLVEANQFAITEIARLTGLDSEELSVSTTSRTYFNGQDRRRVRTEDVLGPYMSAIEGRLSMSDVSPAGYYAAFDLSSYLRTDDLTAAQADSMLIAAGVLRKREARERRNLDPDAPEDATPADPAEVRAAVAASVAIESAKERVTRV